MLDYSNTFGLKTIVFRHSTIYGPHQFATKEQGWVGWFCQKAYEIKTKKSTKPFRISGNGKQVRDLLYITDAVNCYMNATKNIDAISGQAYNIGGGVKNSLSLIELFNYLEKLLNIKMKYIQKSWRKSDQKIFIADTSKANNDFGWKPKIDWQTGVDNMYSWTKKVNE
jgi:CDP-paratose 2-epimerase